MKRIDLVKIIGLTVATVLIVFGSIENLWRSTKFGLEKLLKN